MLKSHLKTHMTTNAEKNNLTEDNADGKMLHTHRVWWQWMSCYHSLLISITVMYPGAKIPNTAWAWDKNRWQFVNLSMEKKDLQLLFPVLSHIQLALEDKHTWHSLKIHSWGPSFCSRFMYWNISVTMSSTCSETQHNLRMFILSYCFVYRSRSRQTK